MDVTSGSELEVMESELYEFLPTLSEEELETVFEKMQATCPEAAKGKKHILVRLIYKQMVLVLASEDNGFATIKVIHEYVTSLKGVKVEEKPLSDEEELSKFEAMLDKKIKALSVDLIKTNQLATGNKVEVSKFQTLKINGTIGTKSGCMSYTDLNFQINNAQKQGYSDEQISGAVIKAMSTNNNLRTYFESVPDVKLVDMLEILRPYFEQKNSATLFADLCNAAQASEQNCMDFVVGLLGLKLRIADLSAEEGQPMDQKRLVGQFQKSLFTGIRNTNIRTEIREFCRGNPDATDQMLIKTVAEAMAIERDRASKMAGGKEVCYVGVNLEENVQSVPSKPSGPANNNNKKKENLLPAIVMELQASQQQLIGSVCELQSAMATTNNLLATRLPNFAQSLQNFNQPGFSQVQDFHTGIMSNPQLGQGPNSFRKKKSNECQGCFLANAPRCNHCFLCGSEGGHKVKDCPKKINSQNGQGGVQQPLVAGGNTVPKEN